MTLESILFEMKQGFEEENRFEEIVSTVSIVGKGHNNKLKSTQ